MPAIVQSDIDNIADAVLVMPYPGAVTPGSHLGVVWTFFSGLGAPALTSVTDSINGAWTTAGMPNVVTGDGLVRVGYAFFPATAAGTPTVTITPASLLVGVAATIVEVSGVQASSPVDASGVGSGSSATASASAAASSRATVAIAGVSQSGGDVTYTPDAGDGWVLLKEITSTAIHCLHTNTKAPTVGVGPTSPVTLSASRQWAEILVTLIAPTAGPDDGTWQPMTVVAGGATKPWIAHI